MTDTTFLLTVDGRPDPLEVGPIVADAFACPVCGHGDLSTWADDGEADDADWWECQRYGGGCGAHGALVRRDNPAVTLNGVAVARPAQPMRIRLVDDLNNVAYIWRTPAGDWFCATDRGIPMALSNYCRNEMVLRFALEDAGDDPQAALAAVARHVWSRQNPSLVTA